ncbi:predicted protein [Postia placenta Mad-698-R]|uniref:F-box domain-containing protein n=1 Tax=Postia placenta MAD-698-R-SB12 TaxID=670580 RepID=A0A1X6NAN1_9APHY|nr:hypothetical protein POSPLADRAFT_1135239 [Postia placenta MAD-698-R-SB12]EED80820.1 predicted protein [Postia placenta Mad-698-R]OSX65624.1 hypothetical protein POSPLADRAFT_1135239 [Postia placenta MAD-698-R-SB12]
MVLALLASLPRSRLAAVQRRIAPLLQFDVLGLLPDEMALQVLSYLPFEALLTCALVSRRWRMLADDQSLWRVLCTEQRWEWRNPPVPRDRGYVSDLDDAEDSDDEGMGDEEDSELAVQDMLLDDSGFSSMLVDPASASLTSTRGPEVVIPRRRDRESTRRNSASASLLPQRSTSPSGPDYKLLHQTHTKIHNRILSGSYRLYNLQTSNALNSHTNAIYCLQLYTYPETGVQVLFTGSKDRSIREWDLVTGAVTRVIADAHESSVLSICVHDGILVSGGSDWQVTAWDLKSNTRIKSIRDHRDSVLCVRYDGRRLASCSKDRTVRTYLMPDFTPHHVLYCHRAAVNAVAMSATHIVSASGDRSIRLWDAETGTLLRTFENHHGRGIAAIDFRPPVILSGSSDKHLRLLDITTSKGWSTAPDFIRTLDTANETVCETCGNTTRVATAAENVRSPGWPRAHEDLVRSVALSAEFVVSGSYDYTVKVWNRKTGALVADLAGGHNGRIFCVGFDRAKVVSCGEDQRICIWDFSHGMDTSFVKL